MLPRELFHIGGLTVYTFGAFIAMGMIAGLLVANSEVARKKLSEDAFLFAVMAAFAGGLVGARLLYAAVHPGDYMANPIELLHIENGGMALFGGLGLGVVAAYFAARRFRLPFMLALDAAAPGIALAYGIGRIGCDVYGKVTHLPWAVWVNGVPHQPSQFYLSIIGFATFAFLWARRRHTTFDGELFAWYVGLYAIGRFLVEFTRYPDAMVGPLTLTQAVLIPVGLAALALIARGVRTPSRRATY